MNEQAQENAIGLENGLSLSKDSSFDEAEAVEAALVNTNQVSCYSIVLHSASNPMAIL